jgi:hypothetical protein
LKRVGKKLSEGKEKKKQHFVPRFYLKQFTYDDYRLYVFDKFKKNLYGSNINDVASERYFYDFPEDPANQHGIDPQLIENALSEIEAGFAKTVGSFLKRAQRETKRIIKPRHKKTLSYFIGLQSTRTKEHRSLQKQMIEGSMEALISKTKQDDSDDEYLVEVDEAYVSLLQAMSMFNPHLQGQLTKVLLNHIWLLGVNNTTQPLYTSDHPIVKMPHKKDPHQIQSYSGFASEGIEIALPLASKYILILCERTFHKHFVSKDGQSIVLDSNGVTYYNSLQVSQSYRQVYCSSNSFVLAEEMCNKHPELCEPDRTRILVD